MKCTLDYNIYFFSIDLLNITPKMSQKQRKKLRTVSESSPSKPEEPESSSPKNAWNMKCCSPPSDNAEKYNYFGYILNDDIDSLN